MKQYVRNHLHLGIDILPHRSRSQRNRCPLGWKKDVEECRLERWRCTRRRSPYQWVSVGKTINEIGDNVSLLNIKPERVSRGGVVGFGEIASICGVKCGHRETFVGRRCLVVGSTGEN